MIRRLTVAIALLVVSALPPTLSALPNVKAASPYLTALERAAAGQRVLAVASVEANAPTVAPKVVPGASVEDALRTVGAAASGGPVRIVPVKVGAAWVMAPETRETVNLNARPLDLGGGSIDGFLSAVPAGLIKSLGTVDGVAVSSLPEAARDRLQRAVRSPLRISTPVPNGAAGGLRGATRAADAQWVSDELDWSRVRVAAHLVVYGLQWKLRGRNPDGSKVSRPVYGTTWDTTSLPAEPPKGTREVSLNTGLSRNNSYMSGALPWLPSVPNTMKPSDLEGAAYTQPLRLPGVRTTGELAARIADVTGLKLSVARVFRGIPVFVGSEELTSGEAIDGLRLALTAAWRKLGDGYVLGWDRDGIAPIQQRLLDAWSLVLPKDDADPMEAVDRSPAWLQLAKDLPFSKGDPLALTQTQRGRILAQYAKQVRYPGIDSTDPIAPTLGWKELTSAQRAWAKAHKADTASRVWVRGKQVNRKLTAAELAQGELNGMLRVEVELITPDHGRLLLTEAAGYGDLKVRRLYPRPARPMPGPEDSEPGRQMALEELRTPFPISVGGPLAAVAVPPLDGDRLKTLATEMKAHGLTTLFYPVLFDGYATFATNAFPRHPALKGSDGWAAAVAAMKPAGITVVGMLNTLTWRRTSDKDHWLDAHPEWLDRDMLGRTSGEWAAANPGAQRLSSIALAGGADFVRPMEPEVERRLMSLIRDFGAQNGAQGIAFSQWMPAAPALYGRPRTTLIENRPQGLFEEGYRPPSMGFAQPERVARIAVSGDDPVDMWDRSYPGLPGPRAYTAFPPLYDDREDTSVPDPYLPLLSRLLKAAKAQRPLKTYVVYDVPSFEEFGHDRDNESGPALPADMHVGGIGPDNRLAAFLIPIWRKGAPEAGPAADQSPVNRAIVPFAAMSHGAMDLDKGIPVLLDFRFAPEEIPNVLKDIHPPKTASPKGRPGPSGGRR